LSFQAAEGFRIKLEREISTKNGERGLISHPCHAYDMERNLGVRLEDGVKRKRRVGKTGQLKPAARIEQGNSEPEKKKGG